MTVFTGSATLAGTGGIVTMRILASAALSGAGSLSPPFVTVFDHQAKAQLSGVGVLGMIYQASAALGVGGSGGMSVNAWPILAPPAPPRIIVNAFEIPLTPSTPQTFEVTLAGQTYNMTLRWNNCSLSAGWILDIADESSNPIVSGIPLVTGADLLAQYPDKNFGGSLYVRSTPPLPPDAPPTFDNLGQDSHLYFLPAAA